jgi:hypothetical protein
LFLPCRPIGHLRDLPRSAAGSHYAAATERSLRPGQRTRLAEKAQRDKKFPSVSKFLPNTLLRWFGTYSKYALVRRPKFPAPGDRSLLPISDHTKVAIAGDWATGTDEAARVSALMANKKPDFTIHLGDVYYVGDKQSIAENCCNAPQGDGYDGVLWPAGKLGTFALNGNHEAYARDIAYFDWIGQTLHQPSSCFMLYSNYWCIVGLDTGYNSEGTPWISWLSERYNWPIFKPSCELPPEVMNWLNSKVQSYLASGRGIIFLSHHQYYSAFDSEYTKPARQLAEIPSLRVRPVLWLWGHEHRLSGYDLYNNGGIPAFGRCLATVACPWTGEKSPAPTAQFCSMTIAPTIPHSTKSLPVVQSTESMATLYWSSQALLSKSCITTSPTR